MNPDLAEGSPLAGNAADPSKRGLPKGSLHLKILRMQNDDDGKRLTFCIIHYKYDD